MGCLPYNRLSNYLFLEKKLRQAEAAGHSAKLIVVPPWKVTSSKRRFEWAQRLITRRLRVASA